ncbi:hypothetical protein EIN_270400 [Entamoeba invadens IP1]|uniref:MULE transposase domain-containing protein n=1 Tax=Entamoeba invadens IP1 TaxID=370355 RepID=A0A0A1U887_ENTIV|nr:hypothetical protein EIN_270400 [Entamoeba invadens IP1]ELP91144.1 hypothetical protein EIN_270400 [Entamoeba invadens IP1]|eukprot:XP_004257915.1 hypothetical protein EIN_270400 [Entamoeba invadens IP1]
MSIKSTRGKELPIYDGYLFHAIDKERTHFRCSCRKCKVTIIKNTDGCYHYGKTTTHIHKKQDLRRKNHSNFIKNDLQTSPTKKLTMKSFITKYKRGSIGITQSTLERFVQRNKVHKIEPNSYDDIIISVGDFNLLFKDEQIGILIFGNSEQLTMLARCKEVFMDGTFRSCPKQFYQLYTLHCQLQNNQTFPAIHYLLKNKTLNTYETLFNAIECLLKEINENYTCFGRNVVVVTDFKNSLIAVLRKYKTFGLKHKGCLFHQRQAIRKFINNAGLKCEYSLNTEFKAAVKILESVCFLKKRY